MKPAIRYQSQLLLRKSYKPKRVIRIKPALMNLRLMQSLSVAQSTGNTLVLGVPGFLPMKNGKAVPTERKPEDGAS